VGYRVDGGAVKDAALTADINLNPEGVEGAATEVVTPDLALAKILKPHQLAGVCFAYRNVVHSLADLRASNPLKSMEAASGCVLAHNMGSVNAFSASASFHFLTQISTLPPPSSPCLFLLFPCIIRCPKRATSSNSLTV
jgi:hypothetical protein